MNKMKKLLSLVLASAMTLSMLAGCSSKEEPTPAPEAAPEVHTPSITADEVDLTQITNPANFVTDLAPETVVATVGDYDITAEMLMYWFNYAATYTLQQYAYLGMTDVNWTAEMDDGTTLAQTVLDSALEMELDEACYEKLREDLAAGSKLLYVCDNAGEIGFDRLLAEQIHAVYPDLQITFCVRGGPASNDATREDAAEVGIRFPVIDNGCTVAGTELDLLPPQTLERFQTADVILSKGQANVETLYGCGLNIYYLFLIKCVRFQEFFGKEKLTPMLLCER